MKEFPPLCFDNKDLRIERKTFQLKCGGTIDYEQATGNPKAQFSYYYYYSPNLSYYIKL